MIKIEYNNVILHVPKRYYHDNLTNRFKNNVYEKEETSLINKYFNENDNVLEIGSCLGYITTLLSRKCKYIISVEANPELKDVLELTKTENKLTNVTLINGFISNTKDNVQFQTYDNIVAGSGDREDLSINNARGWGHTIKKYELKTINLNTIDKIDTINSFMLDMEGGELYFLDENKEYIKNKINKICLELHGHLMKDPEYNDKCMKLLVSLGFSLKQRTGNSYLYIKN